MVIFGLWAECDDEIGLGKLREHFHEQKFKLLKGREIRFHAAVENSDVLGLNVSPSIYGSGRGIESLQEALEATEAGIFLYHHLRSAPDFKFAYIGWNADASTSLDLTEDVTAWKDGRLGWPGCECVLNDELYKELGSPVPFWQFRKGYWWQKYSGEKYTPLHSSDQESLNELCERLLPGNFDRSGGMH